jgi:hypothetical protein
LNEIEKAQKPQYSYDFMQENYFGYEMQALFSKRLIPWTSDMLIFPARLISRRSSQRALKHGAMKGLDAADRYEARSIRRAGQS